MKALLDQYFENRTRIFEAFGYVEAIRVLPMRDERAAYWMLVGGEERGAQCVISDEPFTREGISGGEQTFGGRIFNQRHLHRWVHRAHGLVLVAISPGDDTGQYLAVLSAERECTDETLRGCYADRWGG